MNKSESIKGLAAALAKAQAEMPAVKFDATNPFLKNKYASLGAVIETAKPVLARHGLAVVQTPVSDAEKVGVTTLITHESGEWLEDTIMLEMGDEKGKSRAQVAGSVITYLRRYSLSAVLNMYADEDNDGHAQNKQAEQKPAQKPDQLALAVQRYTVLQTEAAKVGIKDIANLTGGENYDEVVAAGKALANRIKEGK